MFDMEMEDLFGQNIQGKSLFNCKEIQLKYKKRFYGNGMGTDRKEMKLLLLE